MLILQTAESSTCASKELLDPMDVLLGMSSTSSPFNVTTLKTWLAVKNTMETLIPRLRRNWKIEINSSLLQSLLFSDTYDSNVKKSLNQSRDEWDRKRTKSWHWHHDDHQNNSVNNINNCITTSFTSKESINRLYLADYFMMTFPWITFTPFRLLVSIVSLSCLFVTITSTDCEVAGLEEEVFLAVLLDYELGSWWGIFHEVMHQQHELLVLQFCFAIPVWHWHDGHFSLHVFIINAITIFNVWSSEKRKSVTSINSTKQHSHKREKVLDWWNEWN